MFIDESLTAKGFTPGDQVPDRTIEWLTIHHWGALGQTHDGVNAFFCKTGPGATSAHYVVSAGRVNCIVSPGDVAWHAGNWDANKRSVGLELRPEATEDDYRQAAELIAHLRAQFGNPDLPLRPHRDFYNTACPGVYDLKKLDAMARAIANPATVTVVPQSAPGAAPAAVREPVEGEFRVDPGDTLTSIANQFGWTVQSIIDANPGINPNVIKPGEIYKDGHAAQPEPALPPYCTVDPGDTLSGIADQYGVSLQYILDRNPGVNPNVIYPGQRINL